MNLHAFLRGGAVLAALLATGACNDQITDSAARPLPGDTVPRTTISIAALPSVNVVALIDTVDNTIIADSTSAYDVPTTTQTNHFRAAVDSVLAGRVAGADALLAQYGYDVYSIREAVTGDSLVVFRERAPAGGADVPRGWGTYVYNPSPTARRADIHANHPISDLNTEDMAADLYQRCRCRWLFVAGAERDANHLDPAQQSDMARVTNSVFHQMYTRVAAANVRTLSIHGFVASKHTLPSGVDHVLSNGGRFLNDAAQTYTAADTTLRTRLVNNGFVSGLFNRDAGYDELGATVNPQGQHSNNSFGFGRWMSIETEKNVRDSTTLRATMNTVLRQWIIDFPA
ncbi:MAG TPA: hypothetical protein VF746_11730 [Longimicrobium sp.]|jgi:hypothetical protein